MESLCLHTVVEQNSLCNQLLLKEIPGHSYGDPARNCWSLKSLAEKTE